VIHRNNLLLVTIFSFNHYDTIASSYHQETWDMKWNLRSLVMALRGHMLTQPKEIGSIVTTPDRQRFLAAMSRHYVCRQCGTTHARLLGDELIAHAENDYSTTASTATLSSDDILVNSKLIPRRLKKKKVKSGKSDNNNDNSNGSERITGRNIEKTRNRNKLSLVFATKGMVLLLFSALLLFYQLHYV
jgi:hypothetical protein